MGPSGVVLASCALLLGCSTVRSSSVATAAAPAYAGSVRVRATDVPEGAQQVGVIEANARTVSEFPALVARFAAEAARLGGDYAKIDDIRTQFDTVTRAQSYTYQCGQATCTGTRRVTSEVGVTTVHGRAFRTGPNTDEDR